MRVSERGVGLLAIAALLLPAPARADELLVMPYACTMAGGQPVLTPGPERSHRIIGARDQRRYSACSPVNPDMCRQWTLHRFDLDCDGLRVPWVSVVAATNEGSRRAWLLDGRLVLRMGAGWSLAPDDPCAREADPDNRFGSRRMRRYCADQLAMAPPPVVEMPFGYAPMLGVDGIFVKAAPGVSGGPSLPPVSAAPPPSRSAAAGPLQELFPSAEPRAPEPRRGAIADEAPPAKSVAAEPLAAQPLPPAQPPPRIAAPPAVPAPPAEVPRAASANPAPAQATKAAPAEAKPAPPTPNLGPRIVALSPPAPKPPDSAGTAAPATETKAATSSATPVQKTAAGAPRKDGEPAGAAPDATAGPGDSSSGVSLLSVFRATTTGAIVAFAGLALGLLAAFALARRREYQSDARRRPRDLAAVSLDGKRGRTPARAIGTPGNPRPSPVAPASGQVPGQTAAAGAMAQWGNDMPRTRAEALLVLGIGVAPTANDAAIKKIVDGLRQSWHPDLAKDDTDRAMRELRSKQINVAWDLLRSQRAEV